MATKSMGMPHMQKESGEKRAFLPEFIQYMTRFVNVYLAEGYGSRMGFSFDDYRQGNPRVFQAERRDTFQKDFVMILRSPSEEEFHWIRPGSCLISMLHYPTRPNRVQVLNSLKVNAISLDSIIDDNNLRLVENMRSVAWNGLEVAFDELEKTWPDLTKESREPFHVLVLGAGMVGKHAVEAATKLGNIQRNNKHIEQNGPGSVAWSIGRNAIGNLPYLESVFQRTDILVDATQRRDASLPVVPNEWIGWLPEHAVVVDLSVDPYLLNHEPPVVRGIEGIPQGNLNKYVFHPQDKDWDLTVPASIPSANRRTTATCYSWPGIHPEACMAHYGRQLEPLMEVLLQEAYDNINLSGGYFQRALARAKLPEIN
jgi:alanine dehydrogenase